MTYCEHFIVFCVLRCWLYKYKHFLLNMVNMISQKEGWAYTILSPRICIIFVECQRSFGVNGSNFEKYVNAKCNAKLVQISKMEVKTNVILGMLVYHI